jgi:hypothetical protein
MRLCAKLKTNKFFKKLGIFGSLLPPLGLFSQNKFFFLSLSPTHSFWQIERSFKSKFDQMPKKLPHFPIIEILPHKRTVFANKRVLTKHRKFNSPIFEIHTSGWLIQLLWP